MDTNTQSANHSAHQSAERSGRADLAAQLSVYAVTHRYGSDEQLLAELEQALSAGVRIVQLREKGYQGKALLGLAQRVRTVTAAHQARLIINDDPALAREVGADGVHLGQSDGNIEQARRLLGQQAIIGATAHNVAEAVQAQADGADYLGVGDVFGSASKADTVPLPIETLRAIVASVSIPIVAIGGISAENARQLAGTGIDGLAVISAIFGRTDIPAQVARLQAAASRLQDMAAASRPQDLAAASRLQDMAAASRPQDLAAASRLQDRAAASWLQDMAAASRTRIATALTIAGSDCSGGAGIQADLKTMTVHGVYGMSAITALTAQNTTGVQNILEVPPEFVARQLDSIFTDIRPDSVKIGMVASAAIIARIAGKLREYQAAHVVVDPVMVATSGSNLMADSAVATLIADLFPLAELVTPNRFEAEALCGFPIDTEADMERAAAAILRFGCRAVLVKGGHIGTTASDYLATAAGGQWLRSRRIDNPNTHGTGCTLSTAIACNLAKGMALTEAVGRAKDYLTEAIAAGLDLGTGRGPLLHMAGNCLTP